ncbi:hypothetical protein [Thermus hydrothermalis]|uniref:hypothetical protein n=1 Tax=Thermus hydrothermalis TaxID=2908148 RepID=UPI001FA9ADA8|nr:hypothetical protein [Thermus hydrothermalis]
MDLREELAALHVALRRNTEEILAELRALREEREREARARLWERALLILALAVGLMGWWRP